MYKLSYYLTGGSVRFKSFETLHEATVFANEQPINSVIEIKYYDDVDNKKPDRN
jgi:hypothetical protein